MSALVQGLVARDERGSSLIFSSEATTTYLIPGDLLVRRTPTVTQLKGKLEAQRDRWLQRRGPEFFPRLQKA